MHSKNFKIVLRFCLLGSFLALLTSCVTTEDKIFTAKASKEKAIETRVQIAINYLKKNDSETAIEHLNAALESDPESPRVHEVLGFAFASQGEKELAEEHYRKALKYDSNYSRGRNNFAVFLYANGRFKEAKKEFEKVVDDVYYNNRADAFLNLGMCELALKDKEAAETAFRRSVALNHHEPMAHLELAYILYEKGNFPDAQKHLDQYRGLVSKANPRSLLLGVKLAEIFDDKDRVASYSMVLKNLYPTSAEYLELKRAREAK